MPEYDTTPNLGLRRPVVGQANWGTHINATIDTLDAQPSLSAHEADTTAIHGITDTAQLAVLADLKKVTITQQAANYILALGDAGTEVEGTKATAQTVTVPPNVDVAFPVGTVINVRQIGAGQITITAGAGVTLRTPSGAKTRAQYSTGTLIQRVANEWVVGGDVAT